MCLAAFERTFFIIVSSWNKSIISLLHKADTMYA